jgi:polysaccharide deacetylase family protein (PEP-CTERM system associated)
MRNCLTVDVEEWFHVCGVGGPLGVEHWDSLQSRVVDNTHDLLNLLERCRVQGTFFVLGWVARRYPELVRDIAQAGHEIGSHGFLHQRVYELSPQQFAADLKAAREALAAAGVPGVLGYRAPEWSINGRSLWALDLLAESGFTFDSSMAPLRFVGDPRYLERPHVRPTAFGSLHEFPPMVARRFGQNMPLGGGWGLRMSDPRRVIRAVQARNDAGVPVALTVHPWEIDPDPPKVSLPLPKRFVHYFRLGGFRHRLERVLRGADFAPMGEVLALPPVSA